MSFVAGIVNVAGFISIQQLTTNVTGHFAHFVDEVFKLNLWQGFIYFLYIFFFFLGSFVSGWLVEFMAKRNERMIYVTPVIIESLTLLTIGVFYPYIITSIPNTITFGLLFIMGLQNSLVTSLSNAVVRTTHLTGLFTDLGIEFSQLFFYRSREHKQKLFSSIKLRLTIISFFFIGGIVGGVLYSKISLHVLIIAGILLITGLIYDNIRFRIIQLTRKRRK